MDLNTIWFLLIGVLIAGYAVLEAADGRRFVLTPLRNWVAF